jgi:RimJ/RimL family protein N-acetyltransferase
MTILLRTARLTLRRFTEADAANLFALHADPEVIRHTSAWFEGGGRPVDFDTVVRRTLPGFLARYERDGAFAFWAADDLQSGVFQGWFQFSPAATPGQVELGYRLRKAVWGQGLATEGARALVECGFEDLGVARVVASALLANPASIRVMEKVGLRRLNEFLHDPGGPAVTYALDRAAFEAARRTGGA